MTIRRIGITLFAALCFLAGWTAKPNVCSAQEYGYQAPPVQVYTYPDYYGYALPAPVSSGYYITSPGPPPCKHKHWRKHKHKHKHKCKHDYQY